MSSCSSNAGMETSAPLINAIVNDTVQLAHQSDVASNHSLPALFPGKLNAPDSVISCIVVRAVRWPEIWKFTWVSYIIALLEWRQRMMHRMSE